MSRTKLIKPSGDIKIIFFNFYRAMKWTWVINNKKENGTFLGLNSTWSKEEKSGGNDLHDRSAKIHVYHLFKSRWGKEEPSVRSSVCSFWEPGSSFWWMCVHQCCSHERAGRGTGWCLFRPWVCSEEEGDPLWRLSLLVEGCESYSMVLHFILIVASWKSGFVSNKTSPWSTLPLAGNLYVSFILSSKEE